MSKISQDVIFLKLSPSHQLVINVCIEDLKRKISRFDSSINTEINAKNIFRKLFLGDFYPSSNDIIGFPFHRNIEANFRMIALNKSVEIDISFEERFISAVEDSFDISVANTEEKLGSLSLKLENSVTTSVTLNLFAEEFAVVRNGIVCEFFPHTNGNMSFARHGQLNFSSPSFSQSILPVISQASSASATSGSFAAAVATPVSNPVVYPPRFSFPPPSLTIPRPRLSSPPLQRPYLPRVPQPRGQSWPRNQFQQGFRDYPSSDPGTASRAQHLQFVQQSLGKNRNSNEVHTYESISGGGTDETDTWSSGSRQNKRKNRKTKNKKTNITSTPRTRQDPENVPTSTQSKNSHATGGAVGQISSNIYSKIKQVNFVPAKGDRTEEKIATFIQSLKEGMNSAELSRLASSTLISDSDEEEDRDELNKILQQSVLQNLPDNSAITVVQVHRDNVNDDTLVHNEPSSADVTIRRLSVSVQNEPLENLQEV